MTNTTNKPILLIGGPADGHRMLIEPKQRTVRIAELQDLPADHAAPATVNAPAFHYAVGTVQGAFHGVFYVGVQNLTDCVICALLAGYRKPQAHYTDLNVAEHLVTLLGGAADGKQVTVPSNCVFIPEMGDGYQVVPLVCKDGRTFRVGVLDMLTVDPIALLVEGYRVEKAK